MLNFNTPNDPEDSDLTPEELAELEELENDPETMALLTGEKIPDDREDDLDDLLDDPETMALLTGGAGALSGTSLDDGKNPENEYQNNLNRLMELRRERQRTIGAAKIRQIEDKIEAIEIRLDELDKRRDSQTSYQTTPDDSFNYKEADYWDFAEGVDEAMESTGLGDPLDTPEDVIGDVLEDIRYGLDIDFDTSLDPDSDFEDEFDF
ncbi:hypothetical protein ACFL21_00690 [Patescibacteria group bacterium]